VLGFSFNDVTATDGWAAMNPANWQAQIDYLRGAEAVQGRDADGGRRDDTDILSATESLRKQIG